MKIIDVVLFIPSFLELEKCVPKFLDIQENTLQSSFYLTKVVFVSSIYRCFVEMQRTIETLTYHLVSRNWNQDLELSLSYSTGSFRSYMLSILLYLWENQENSVLAYLTPILR